MLGASEGGDAVRIPLFSRWLEERKEQQRHEEEWHKAYLRKQDAAIDAVLVAYDYRQMNDDIGCDEPGWWDEEVSEEQYWDGCWALFGPFGLFKAVEAMP